MNKQELRVALLTPYLAERMEDRETAEYVREQREKYGYDSNNFSSIDRFDATNASVKLLKPRLHRRSTIDTYVDPHRSDIVLIGSARDVEYGLRDNKDKGAINARFSIFYGGPSNYTGFQPEESGYALDLPKDVSVARALITHPTVIEGLLKRDEGIIRSGIDELNKDLPQPVLITPFLSEALKVKVN